MPFVGELEDETCNTTYHSTDTPGAGISLCFLLFNVCVGWFELWMPFALQLENPPIGMLFRLVQLHKLGFEVTCCLQVFEYFVFVFLQ